MDTVIPSPSWLNNFYERFANHFDSSTVFGTPLSSGRTTIVPVAKVRFGMGAGFGSEDEKSKESEAKHGGGGGGGGMVIPMGFIELSDRGARFRRIWDSQSLVRMALGLVFGAFVSARILNRKSRSSSTEVSKK